MRVFSVHARADIGGVGDAKRAGVESLHGVAELQPSSATAEVQEAERALSASAQASPEVQSLQSPRAHAKKDHTKTDTIPAYAYPLLVANFDADSDHVSFALGR